jgi:hypothetical protein
VWGGVEPTAYLVDESRARMPEPADDGPVTAWIPENERGAVRALWDEFTGATDILTHVWDEHFATGQSEAPMLEAGGVPALLERIVSPLLANPGRYARSTMVSAGAGSAPCGSTSSTTAPAFRGLSPTSHSLPAGARIPATDTTARPSARFTVSLPAG